MNHIDDIDYQKHHNGIPNFSSLNPKLPYPNSLPLALIGCYCLLPPSQSDCATSRSLFFVPK